MVSHARRAYPGSRSGLLVAAGSTGRPGDSEISHLQVAPAMGRKGMGPPLFTQLRHNIVSPSWKLLVPLQAPVIPLQASRVRAGDFAMQVAEEFV